MQARRVGSAMAFIVASILPAPTAACQMKMALEQWAPYVYTQPNGPPSGLDLELVQAIFKEAGCTLQLLPELPTARRQRQFELGELDLLLAASDTVERRKLARFSLAYRHESVGVFTRSANLARYQDVRNLEVLLKKKLSLLAPKVGWYGPNYARVQPELLAAGHLSTFLTFQQGLRMLDAGRAELILGDSVALRHEAKEQGIAIAPLPFMVLRAPVHLMLNKNSTTQAQLDLLNGAIQRLEKQGVLAEIRSRYGDS
ncbi:ABC transporter substrate-binding protein [Duganella sp. HH105]|uniref:substrate-binding periplasmic protein n=1 Tax=Duganella sp. HH105 TaxID=1781067 RepID=UPI00089310D8|nr:transporter substrate-binding domain-containing protein [Duganella sp. HH105]OEZ56546.1 bacterial extracellular solute-binding protein, family 3 [Duganella sp. HH105]